MLTFLRRRRGLLDAVVFPVVNPRRNGHCRMRFVRSVNWDTRSACTAPAVIRVAWPGYWDWSTGSASISKALPEDYPALTGVPDSGVRAFESLAYLQESGVAFEVRITVHATLLPRTRLECLLNRLEKSGVRCVMLQRCRDERMLDTSLGINPAPSLDADRCRIGEWRNAWSEGYA